MNWPSFRFNDLTDEAYAGGWRITQILRKHPARAVHQAELPPLYPREHVECPNCGTICRGSHECPRKEQARVVRMDRRRP